MQLRPKPTAEVLRGPQQRPTTAAAQQQQQQQPQSREQPQPPEQATTAASIPARTAAQVVAASQPPPSLVPTLPPAPSTGENDRVNFLEKAVQQLSAQMEKLLHLMTPQPQLPQPWVPYPRYHAY